MEELQVHQEDRELDEPNKRAINALEDEGEEEGAVLNVGHDEVPDVKAEGAVVEQGYDQADVGDGADGCKHEGVIIPSATTIDDDLIV